MMGDFISAPALRAHLQRNGDTVAIDVRSARSFATGHIPGAMSIPFTRFKKHIEQAPHDKTLVIYCAFRQPGHSESEQAAVLLRDRGYVVKVLYGGFPAWRDSGSPIEKSQRQTRADESEEQSADAE